MKLNNILFQLIDSKVIKVLSLFFIKKDYKYSLSEIAKLSKVSKASVYRILKRLVDLKLINYDEFKSIKVYYLNKNKIVLDLGELFYPPKTYKEALEEYFNEVSNLSRVYKSRVNNAKEIHLIAIVVKTSQSFEKEFKDKVNSILKLFDKRSDVVFQTAEQFEQFKKMGVYKDLIEIFRI